MCILPLRALQQLLHFLYGPVCHSSRTLSFVLPKSVCCVGQSIHAAHRQYQELDIDLSLCLWVACFLSASISYHVLILVTQRNISHLLYMFIPLLVCVVNPSLILMVMWSSLFFFHSNHILTVD